MARVRRIVVSQVEGDYSNDSDKRPNGEIALYDDNNGGFDLVIHDGVNGTSDNKILGKGLVYQSDYSSGFVNRPLWYVQNEGTISYRRIDGESKTLKVHWGAKVFYGNELYD